MRDPIKLAAKGSKIDKIAPPDLDCKIFFSFHREVSFFKAMALISFCEGFTFLLFWGKLLSCFS